jgi:transcriptional regulator NrdR family protein
MKKRATIPSITCPHCKSRASIRTSSAVSDLFRQIRFRCENDECGHVFAADLVVVRTIVPSAIPNPAIKLPFANPNLCRARTGLKPANDDAPVPANDDEQLLHAAVTTAPT